ncbi:hypothetical protein [Halorientalis halophila]|uniref:hypothetical protein n=1 Tax=Halorientalis halophila TaxID=3108499 RepID=UPI0030081813
MTSSVDWLTSRASERTLARLTIAFALCSVVLLVGIAWYVGSLGLSMGAMAYDGDDRTIVVDASERAEFARHYDEDREEGWCLFGSTNETHVRIDEVVHARPLDQDAKRVTFTCLPEAGGQLLTGDSANLVGVVHSHPGHNTSELSKLDIAMFGRLSPLVEVMGIYTDADGVAFFTTDSMTNALDTRVAGGAPNGSAANETTDRRIETP